MTPTLRDDLIASVPLAIRVSQDSQAVAEAYNAMRHGVLGIVGRAEFSVWAAGNGLRAKIEDYASDPTSPLRSIALTCRDVILGAASGIDFSLADNRAMLGAWVSVGAITQTQSESLLALATHPDPIDELTIRAACWSDDGIWQL